VLAIECRLDGDGELGLYVLVAPHLGATGHDNVATVERYQGRRVLLAEQGPFGLALAAADEHQADAFGRASAGYVGTSDGWQDFARNGAMASQYRNAGPGNVALIGDCRAARLWRSVSAAAPRRRRPWRYRASIQPFDNVLQQQISDWEGWQTRCAERSPPTLDLPDVIREQAVVSSIVLRAHLDKTYPGAMVASLSVPWGYSANERGGYHLVWPRDLVQCAGALLALGAEPRRATRCAT